MDGLVGHIYLLCDNQLTEFLDSSSVILLPLLFSLLIAINDW
jgi:hypothetical protein